MVSTSAGNLIQHGQWLAESAEFAGETPTPLFCPQPDGRFKTDTRLTDFVLRPKAV